MESYPNSPGTTSDRINLTGEVYGSTSAVLDWQVKVVDYVFIPMLFTVGVVGNSLTIRVMIMRQCWILSVSRFLVALSLSDLTVNLMSPFNEPLVHSLLGADPRATSVGGCKFFFWLYRVGKYSSAWLVVMISSERFVAVWLPTKAKFINTNRKANISIFLMYGVFSFYLAYYTNWSYTIIDGKCTKDNVSWEREDQAAVLDLVGLSIYVLIPMASLVVLTGLIIYKLIGLIKKSRCQIRDDAQAGNMGRCQRDSFIRTTQMLIAISLAFVILEIPSTVSHLISSIRNENIFDSDDLSMVIYKKMASIMEQLNHSINFVLYILTCGTFRTRVFSLFRKKRSGMVNPK
ncbi:hypothetical protein LSH36_380g05003 [Paralvinella palmiformis]|uniref:G-protein coupled receptors family 1 profile domain-containing protein n=1 Tax=Paralvinella palmiformis TaxID=53620 RepID=A0AAD9N1Q0_9ANNE|nr:hypothetical protein LSH36_380g05003 [Paralvinella palmiformis]